MIENDVTRIFELVEIRYSVEEDWRRRKENRHADQELGLCGKSNVITSHLLNGLFLRKCFILFVTES